jgi:hypothetical protein
MFPSSYHEYFYGAYVSLLFTHNKVSGDGLASLESNEG